MSITSKSRMAGADAIPLRRVQPAFTLIELSVVIGIIAILVALFLPALSRAKTQARSTTCKNHLRQMTVALQMYVHDHQGKYPYLRTFRDPDPSSDQVIGIEDNRWWFAKLLPYYPMLWTNPTSRIRAV